MPLRGLVLGQGGTQARAVVPPLASGEAAVVRLRWDRPFGESMLFLADAGRETYPLPPYYFESRLHGSVDVDVGRAAPGAAVSGRARCSTDYPDYLSGDHGWSRLTP
jgi:hypothetical protein